MKVRQASKFSNLNGDNDPSRVKRIGGFLLLCLAAAILGMPLTSKMIADVYVYAEIRETQGFRDKGCVVGKTESATFSHSWRTWECNDGVAKQFIYK